MPGSCLMVSLKGFHLTESEKEFLVSHSIAGVILFKKNIQSFKQVYELCREIKSLTEPPMLIGVDLEGGEINRFSHLKPWPSPKELRGLELSQVSNIACSMAKKLNLLGIDVNFAPVVDLLIRDNPLLKNRRMGDTTEEILKNAGAFLKGCQEGGIIPCLKHFPGHGGVREDSHKLLPKDFRTFPELAPQLSIFQTLFQTYPCWVMTAHIEFPKIEKTPATFSPKLLREELRNKRAFKGLLVSDDIDMEALKSFSSGEKFFFAHKRRLSTRFNLSERRKPKRDCTIFCPQSREKKRASKRASRVFKAPFKNSIQKKEAPS